MVVVVLFEIPNAAVGPVYERWTTLDPPQVGGMIGGMPPLRRVRKGCWVTTPIKIPHAGKERKGWNVSKT